MAYGFGATDGAGSTDKVTLAFSTDSATVRTYSWWAYELSVDHNGRPMSREPVDVFFNNGSSASLEYVRRWSGDDGEWGITDMPALNSWHHFMITYDASLTANDPIFYVDGVSKTVTELSGPPTGTPNTDSVPHNIGNNSTNVRAYDGRLCEFTIWDKIQPASVALSQAAGYSSDFFPDALVSYTRLIRESNDQRNNDASIVTGTVVQNHPRIIYPRRRQAFVTLAAVDGLSIPVAMYNYRRRRAA